MRVDGALGAAGRSGGVGEKQGVGGPDGDAAAVAGGREQVAPGCFAGARGSRGHVVDDDDVLDRRAGLECLGEQRLHLDAAATAHRTVGDDDCDGAGILDSRRDRGGGEAREERDDDRAQRRDGVTGDHGCRNHGQEQGDRVSSLHTEGAKARCDMLHLVLQVAVGEDRGCAVLGDVRHRFRVRVIALPPRDAGIDDVEAGAHEPLGVFDPGTKVEHPGVRRAKGQLQVVHDRIPVPADIGDGCPAQLVEGAQPVGRAEPGHVGAVDVLRRRRPRVFGHERLLGMASMRSAMMLRWMKVDPPAIAVPRDW